MQVTGGGLHQDLFPHLFAQQGPTKGGVLRNPAVHRVGLLGTHHLIGLLLVKLQVQHGDPGAQTDGVVVVLVLLDHHTVGQNLLHLGNPGVELALFVFGLVIFAVLAQIAEGAGLLDLVGYLFFADGLEVSELVLELL